MSGKAALSMWIATVVVAGAAIVRLLAASYEGLEPAEETLGDLEPFLSAAETGDVAMLRSLARDYPQLPRKDDWVGCTAVHYAARCGQLEAVKALIELGADPGRPDDFGETPLVCAVKNRELGVVRYLLQRGVSVNTTDRLGHTPLDYATGGGALAAIRRELRHYGAKPGARTWN